jgi:hypothetical protein
MPTPSRTAPEARAESLRETAAKLNGENTFDLRFLVESPGMKAKRESLRTKRHRRAVETQLTRIADALEAIVLQPVLETLDSYDKPQPRYVSLFNRIADRKE